MQAASRGFGSIERALVGRGRPSGALQPSAFSLQPSPQPSLRASLRASLESSSRLQASETLLTSRSALGCCSWQLRLAARGGREPSGRVAMATQRKKSGGRAQGSKVRQ